MLCFGGVWQLVEIGSSHFSQSPQQIFAMLDIEIMPATSVYIMCVKAMLVIVICYKLLLSCVVIAYADVSILTKTHVKLMPHHSKWTSSMREICWPKQVNQLDDDNGDGW